MQKCPKHIDDYECPDEMMVEGHYWTGKEVEDIRRQQLEVFTKFRDMALDWATNPPTMDEDVKK